MTTAERKLLDRAVTTLLAALAHDEALRCGAPQDQLDQLRGYWVPDAESIVDEAERLGLLDDGLDDIDFGRNGDHADE